MPLHVMQVVSQAELEEITGALESGEFVDGARSSGVIARGAKRNRELVPHQDPSSATINAILTRAFKRHSVYQIWAMPRAATAFLVNRYEAGMFYGDHVDNAVHELGDGKFLRSDLAITVFLSDPATYEGGELVIDADREAQVVKLKAGDAVVYRATSVHRVQPIRRGVRFAAVAWVESLIRDDAQRAVLFDLATIIEKTLRGDPSPERQATLTALSKVRHNLVRMWSEH